MELNMQPAGRARRKHEVWNSFTCLLHCKRTWVAEEDISSLYVQTYLSSTSQKEVIKVEEMEDKPEESTIFKPYNESDLIKNEDSVLEEASNLTTGFARDECGQIFGNNCNLNGHMLIHGGLKEFSCDICKKAFAQKWSLKVHMLTHSGVKSFSCDQCKKAFTRKNYLNQHLLTHSGVKAFPCDVCKKAFAQKGNLTRHKSIHT